MYRFILNQRQSSIDKIVRYIKNTFILYVKYNVPKRLNQIANK